MGLARDSDLFAAGADIHGVHDWSTRVGAAPGATGDLIKLGRECSPISSVEKWKSPVLLIRGDDDRNVAFSQTFELVRKLRERAVEFEELVFPDDVHDSCATRTGCASFTPRPISLTEVEAGAVSELTTNSRLPAPASLVGS